MEFGGNKFTYLTKKKLNKLNELRNKPLRSIKEEAEMSSTKFKSNLIEESKKEEEPKVQLKSKLKEDKIELDLVEERGRSRSRSRSIKLSRQSSNSVCSLVDGELDKVYSCDEKEDDEEVDFDEESDEVVTSIKVPKKR